MGVARDNECQSECGYKQWVCLRLLWVWLQAVGVSKTTVGVATSSGCVGGGMT